jgi:biotin synthase-like enzyme
MSELSDYELILKAENGDFEDDDEILAAAEAIRRSGLQYSVGWAGRFLRDVNEAFGDED